MPNATDSAKNADQRVGRLLRVDGREKLRVGRDPAVSLNSSGRLHALGRFSQRRKCR